MNPTRCLAGATALALFCCALLAAPARGQQPDAPRVRVTLEEAVQLALLHNKTLRAARTTIDQSLHQETTAGLRPNPQLSLSWSPLPLFAPQDTNGNPQGLGNYLSDSSGLGLGLSYTYERGDKREARLKAAKDNTGVTRSQVTDNERALASQVASQFITVQLAESTIEVTEANLKSFENAVAIGESKLKAGGISENDFLKIKLQLLQFQSDIELARLAREQGLADLRQLLGYETVSADYDISGAFDYQPVKVELDGLQKIAAENRPDLRAARQSVDAARSQVTLAEANGTQDLTISVGYSRAPIGGDSTANTANIGLSIPLAIFDRNQGEIARTKVAVTQYELQEAALLGQVMTDVRDALEAVQRNGRITNHYLSGYLDVSKRSRDISEYAYQRGATSLFDFLDAERSYRATELGYRQSLATYLLAVEQLRAVVGTRKLP